jgi:hypothetical protein
MMDNQALYARRRNEEGSYDSICRTCFGTVVRSKSEAELAEYEKVHVCDLSLFVEHSCFSGAESMQQFGSPAYLGQLRIPMWTGGQYWTDRPTQDSLDCSGSTDWLHASKL